MNSRELASNDYPGTRFFTPVNPGDGNFSSPRPRSMYITSRVRGMPASSPSSRRLFSEAGLALTKKPKSLRSTRVAQVLIVTVRSAGRQWASRQLLGLGVYGAE